MPVAWIRRIGQQTVVNKEQDMIIKFWSYTLCGLALCTADASAGDASGERFVPDRGTVLDTKTNLRWQRCSVGLIWFDNKNCVGKLEKFTFRQARSLPDKVIFEELWRVPTKAELESLVQKRDKGFSIDRTIFPDVDIENSMYWTIDMHDAQSPWAVDFEYGNVSYFFGDYVIINNKWSVRLVRVNQNQTSAMLWK